MDHLGDITQIKGDCVPIVDIVTGGSPCQDLSVAGKRAGLDGERSGLFMEQIRIVKEMREHDRADRRTNVDIRPRYMVWENVPGAFSSNKGEDFRCVLEETAKIGCESATIPRPANGKWNKSGCIVGDGWSIAWRLHDAQFWGVPQRRKRICLLADFNGDTAPKILFELFRETECHDSNQVVMDIRDKSESEVQSVSEGLPRNTEPCEQTRKETTEDARECTDSASSYTLKIRGGREIDSLGKRAGKGALIQTELSATLGVAQDQTLIQTERKCESPNGGIISPPLDAHYYLGCGARGGVEREVVCIGNGQADQLKESDKVGALNCMHDQQAVMTYGLDRAAYNQGKNAKYNFSVEQEKIGAQIAKGPGAVYQSVVRRLTPLECERLQGYPDGWTDIGEWVDSKGKKHKDADTPRYKALGNSIALPFWGWLAERIVAQYDRETTMASLFDGIGGFPLVFSRCGCEPVWASEIEEFPIAVTRLRFGEDEDEQMRRLHIQRGQEWG